MIDWIKITDDPLDLDVRAQLEVFIKSISKLSDTSLVQYFCDHVGGQDVLHVGCCEHAEKYMLADGWKHREMASVARSIVGLDINEPGVAAMQAMGYDVICDDATGDADIGRRFDRIIIGDVIEHVGNQQGLLEFAKRHLKPGGQLVVSTPNPFFVLHVARTWFSRPMVANFEHVSWVTESNILELARRCGLSLSEIIYPVGNTANYRVRAMLKKLSYKILGTALFTTNVYVMTN